MTEHVCNSVHHANSGLCSKKVPLFGELSHKEIQKIAKMTKHIPYQKGDMLIQEGEKSNTLFIINSGKVKLSKFTVDGKEQILYLMTTGDFFGELSFLMRMKSITLVHLRLKIQKYAS